MDKKKVVNYLAITFLITWTCWWGLAFLTSSGSVDASQGIFTAIHVLGGFGPTIAAVLVLPQRSFRAVMRFLFSHRRNAVRYLLLFCAMQSLIIGLSSMQTNPEMPWYAVPFVLLSTTFLGGGNEELGWRGILQPELEKRFAFPVATLLTGCVWMAWHIPLWFVVGVSQQSMNFGLYALYGLILSFWLAVLYKKTNCVFYCCVFHGTANLLLSFFVIKINWILIVGLFLSLIFSIWLCYKDQPSALE